MISKQEYIALRETTPAFCAILYSLKLSRFSYDIVTSKEIRNQVQLDTGYPFSELAVAKALNAPKPYSFSERVSGATEIGAYKINTAEAREVFTNLASSQGSFVWQLDNIDHSHFRTAVSQIRTEASKAYKANANYDNPYPGQWMDINLQMTEGIFRQRTGRGAKLPAEQSTTLFLRGASKPEWLAVYIAMVSVIVSLWVGGKL